MTKREWEREHIKRLEFAVHFCQSDLEPSRQGAWLDLKRDLVEFVLWPALGLGEPNLDKALTTEKIKEIQADFKAQLELIADPEAGDPTATRPIKAATCVIAEKKDEPLRRVMNIGPDIRDRALNALYKYIDYPHIRRDQIRFCARSECNRIFLYKRKPRKDVENYHCSNACSQLVAKEAYRERERQRGKRRYAAKIHKRFPHAPIGKKVRKG